MAAQVGSEDVEPVEPLLGEAAKAAAVRLDAMEADGARGSRLPPLVDVKPQSSGSGS